MPSDHPNILLIFTDQHRLSAVGCCDPDSPCKTPNLDRLAAEGVRFETAYTTFTVCSPARATILTGLYPHAHGITANIHEIGCSVMELSDSPMLLPRRLESAGYRNGYTGKWHLGRGLSVSPHNAANKQFLPLDCGFVGQNFPGHGGGGFAYPEYKDYLAQHGWPHEKSERGLSHMGILKQPLESTVPYFLTSHALDLMDHFNDNGEPFFLWHNFWGPHAPYFVTQEYYDMYADVEIPPWPNFECAPHEDSPQRVKQDPGKSWDYWQEQLRHYYAFSSMIDDQIGRMVKHLEERGELENTVILFTADHGSHIGDHGGMTDKGFSHWEETQRIPFIVRAPQRILGDKALSPGTVRPEFVSNVDVYPTVLDFAGVDPAEGGYAQGLSLKPLLEGREPAWRNTIGVEFFGLGCVPTSMTTLRKGDIKYGYNATAKDELYDLSTDPHETINRVDDPAYADTLEEMRYELLAWMHETGSYCRGNLQSRYKLTGRELPPFNRAYCQAGE